MDTSQVAGPSPADQVARKFLTVRQAAFIGVGAMVGVGIFALLGAAGAVAGAAVWLAFLLAGGGRAGHSGAEHRPGLRAETNPPPGRSSAGPGRALS